MVDITPQQIGLEVGGGALVGAIIGFAAKKIAKIIAIIVGLELMLFKFLETKGILIVDWSAISGAASDGADTAAQAPGWVMSFLAALPVGVGFTGGFVVGFKKG
ncbi:FUN14 domain-containing protein [Halorientalis salina]|jgi:uncharacterized membrane protein (Fun14 family)|uniref:FUN14 domain-containing protein n=1 Tax=Halorientalis salina TaxID=2932266 RepID=UPI0010AB9DAC|nr:FUN14 domain-containing protein [Halorientalis salina]